MAVLNINLRSHYLMGDTNISIIMPQCEYDGDPRPFYENCKKYKVLWLLHGGLDDNSGWLRKTGIETYVEKMDLMVVMPSAMLSYYTNWPSINQYFSDYFIDELMPLIYNWFPASRKPEDNFIAGLSMGGLGTLRFAASYPELFAAGAAFSVGSVNLHEPPNGDLTRNIIHYLSLANGGLDAAIDSMDNAWDLLVQNKSRLPRLYVSCGTADPHYEQVYLPFKAHMMEEKVPIDFCEIEGYAHEWALWDLEIQKFLKLIM